MLRDDVLIEAFERKRVDLVELAEVASDEHILMLRSEHAQRGPELAKEIQEADQVCEHTCVTEDEKVTAIISMQKGVPCFM